MYYYLHTSPEYKIDFVGEKIKEKIPQCVNSLISARIRVPPLSILSTLYLNYHALYLFTAPALVDLHMGVT
jgi:hypothetical protein